MPETGSITEQNLNSPAAVHPGIDTGRLRPRGDTILFLDFDGVLHPDPCRYQSDTLCHLPRLEKILRDFPDVEVVISSAWRQDQTIDDLRTYFSADIAQRIIDVTPDWHEVQHLFKRIGPYERQVEIEGWIEQSGWPQMRWIAIDDRPYWFQPGLENLVCCETKVGLTDELEQDIRSRLGLIQKQ
ncbi:hypothetical protein HSX11_18660 [Oxalobacteraceae bacterium]|nr:hypothetical protein [Oxalobacteraceae bacterium]